MVLVRLLLFLLAAVAGTATAQRSPADALRALRDGNERFATERSVVPPLGEGVRRTLAQGQSPFAIVLCCADSRVPPEHVFNCGLGDLFVVRVAGPCTDAETVASIEYAVEHLGAPLCVVLAHESCGAVAASVAQATGDGDALRVDGTTLPQLLERIEPAVRRARERALAGKALHDACEEENAHATVHECLRRSALLRRYAATGRFEIVAARYHLQRGVVEWLPPRPLPAAGDAVPATLDAAVRADVPPHTALRLLQAGHRRFLGDRQPTADLTAVRRESLAHGQQPFAIVLACADSRTAPEHVFDAGLGELFVVRVAGNTLNETTLASIEYAATRLGASLLVVMGHSRCGAVEAAIGHPEQRELSPNLRALLLRLEPSAAAARADANGRDVLDLAVRANTLRALTEARSRSAVLRGLERDGAFAMLGCVYDIASGDLEWLQDAPPTAETPVAAIAPPVPPPVAAVPVPAAPQPAPAPRVARQLPMFDGASPPASPAADVALPAVRPDARPRAAAPRAEAEAERPTWQDPIVLLGMLGVVSLLVAALFAIRRR